MRTRSGIAPPTSRWTSPRNACLQWNPPSFVTRQRLCCTPAKAVDQTAGQMPPYLVTLAFAEFAVGHEKEAGRAAAQAVEGFRRTAGILKPLFDLSRYLEDSRLYCELQQPLDQLEWLE
jgi:hypothetical protein